MKRTIFLSLILLGGALLGAAHGTSLSLSRNRVQPGDRIAIKGVGVGENAVIEITLEGALNSYPLGEVQGNAHGEFQAEVLIPTEVNPGTYTLKAHAGTTAASAPLRVTRSGVPAANKEKLGAALRTQEPVGRGQGAAGEAEAHPSLEPLQLDRAWSRSETATAWGLILLAALVGSLLWFRS